MLLASKPRRLYYLVSASALVFPLSAFIKFTPLQNGHIEYERLNLIRQESNLRHSICVCDFSLDLAFQVSRKYALRISHNNGDMLTAIRSVYGEITEDGRRRYILCLNRSCADCILRLRSPVPCKFACDASVNQCKSLSLHVTKRKSL